MGSYDHAFVFRDFFRVFFNFHIEVFFQTIDFFSVMNERAKNQAVLIFFSDLYRSFDAKTKTIILSHFNFH